MCVLGAVSCITAAAAHFAQYGVAADWVANKVKGMGMVGSDNNLRYL